MELIPIKENLEDNEEFTNNPACRESITATIDFFKKVGYQPPWIGYYVKLADDLVGCAAFKGKPVAGKVEIAYGVFPDKQQKGIGTQIAAMLVRLSLKTDPSITVTARTFAADNYSAKILRKNNFNLVGSVTDDEDGEVWEWEYVPPLNLSANL